MANTVYLTSHNRIDQPELEMSNVSTRIFIDTLVLSGSLLARADREKEFVIWLAQHDQHVIGNGTVSFSLDEMPWEPDHFEENQSFLLRMIELALQRAGWERLSYTPIEKDIRYALTAFRELILLFGQDDIDTSHYEYWRTIEEYDNCRTLPEGYPKCEKHEVYLSCFGCVLCNGES
ncbi:hypothetical protein [Paenibacillus bovis]|uniref:Uncharacterized protein n=1 Tax=Paenibacillus bovis TaxID=1616788 RepID=A0A172ZI05_9BACL|nr:hypothetical protein [Paenibacillus bovis]ANF97271.1 hypothetical protein AR543_15530 [Paenibacillus bovis]